MKQSESSRGPVTTASDASVRIPFARLMVTLALCSSFAPFATDMYLPAFAQVQTAFAADPAQVEMTISIFFLGLGLGQVLYGPLIDRFGRKGPLLAGIGLFVLSTLGCLVTREVHLFIGLRLLQALGGCAGMVIGRAIVTDLFSEREIARVMSTLMMLIAAAPICAPLIGGWLVTLFSWQSVFVALLILGAGTWGLVLLGLPETGKKDRKVARAPFVRTAWQLYQRPGFLLPAVSGSLINAIMFAFITGSPMVFMRYFGLDEVRFSWMFGVVAAALIVSAQVNRVALKRWEPASLFRGAVLANVAGGMGLLLVSGTQQMWLFVVPLWLTIATLGCVLANSTALAMAHCRDHAGTGSGLLGLMQFGAGFLASSIVAAAKSPTPYPMSLTILVCGVLAASIWFGAGFLMEQRKVSHSEQPALRP
jgi:MFS transporter, DHA1 family, multidrug resistance protein